jgi:hypothetical protein
MVGEWITLMDCVRLTVQDASPAGGVAALYALGSIVLAATGRGKAATILGTITALVLAATVASRR